MTISFYKGLTRNLEIGNTPVWVLPNIWRHWGKLGIPNLAQVSLMKCYGILQNARVTAFIVSELLGKTNRGAKIPPPPPRPTQIKVSKLQSSYFSRICDSLYLLYRLEKLQEKFHLYLNSILSQNQQRKR